MNPEELFALPIVIVSVACIMAARRYGASGQAAAISEADRLRAEVTELKERLHVLERVVTDTHSTADLDRRIERLRD